MNPATVSKPCPTCPFRRDVKPGELGGSTVPTFIGQVNGPFWLPCHSCTNYEDPNWKTDYSKPQCAGAAIFRANVGWRWNGPLALLPPSQDIVFGSFAEFVAHHAGITEMGARNALSIFPPDEHTRRELERSGCKFILIPKQQ